jgi:hypothetical protein
MPERSNWLLQCGSRYLLTAVLLSVVLVASGVSLKSSLLVSVVVGLQYVTGTVIRSSIGDSSRVITWGNRAISFATGVLVTSVAHLIFLQSSLSEVGWLLPLIIFGLFYLTKGIKHTNSTESEGEWLYSLSIAFAVTLIVLGRTYRWQLPFGIAVFLFVVMIEFRKKKWPSKSFRYVASTVSFIAVGVLAVLGVWYTFGRSQYWWTINSDITFTEAVSQTLGRWGLGDHAAAVGHTGLGSYHWLPFTWNGLVDRVVGADAWWISTRTAHVVFVFGSAAILWSLFRTSLSYSRLASSFSTLVAALIGLTTGENFTLMVGVFWVLALLVFFAERQHETWGWADACLLFTLTLGALLSKPQMAIPVIGGVLLLDIWRQVRKKQIDLLAGYRIAAMLLATVATVTSQRLLAGDSPAVSGAVGIDFVSLGSFGELGNARNLFAFPLAVVSIFPLVLVPFLALMIARIGGGVPCFGWVAGSSLVVALLTMFISDAIYHSLVLYLVSLIYLLTAVVIGVCLPRIIAIVARKRDLLFFLIGAAFITYLVVDRWPKFFNPGPSGSVVDMALRTVSGASWVPALFVALGTITLVLIRDHKRDLRELVLVGLVSTLVLIGNPVEKGIRALSHVGSNHTVDQSKELGVIAIDNASGGMKAIAALIKQEEIVASNLFCSYDVRTLCADPQWWNRFQEDVISSHFPEGCYNLLIFAIDQSLPGVLERRFLIQGPQMFEWCTNGAPWLEKRVLMSEEFGREATKRSFEFLCSEDVSWFIADRALTSRDSWNPFGEVVVEQDRLVVIRIFTEQCPPKAS